MRPSFRGICLARPLGRRALSMHAPARRPEADADLRAVFQSWVHRRRGAGMTGTTGPSLDRLLASLREYPAVQLPTEAQAMEYARQFDRVPVGDIDTVSRVGLKALFGVVSESTSRAHTKLCKSIYRHIDHSDVGIRIFLPDVIEYFCRAGESEFARRIAHQLARYNPPDWSSVACAFADADDIVSLREVLEESGGRLDTTAYNAIVAAYIRSNMVQSAWDVFDGMLKTGPSPDKDTFIMLMTVANGETAQQLMSWLDTSSAIEPKTKQNLRLYAGVLDQSISAVRAADALEAPDLTQLGLPDVETFRLLLEAGFRIGSRAIGNAMLTSIGWSRDLPQKQYFLYAASLLAGDEQSAIAIFKNATFGTQTRRQAYRYMLLAALMNPETIPLHTALTLISENHVRLARQAAADCVHVAVRMCQNGDDAYASVLSLITFALADDEPSAKMLARLSREVIPLVAVSSQPAGSAAITDVSSSFVYDVYRALMDGGAPHKLSHKMYLIFLESLLHSGSDVEQPLRVYADMSRLDHGYDQHETFRLLFHGLARFRNEGALRRALRGFQADPDLCGDAYLLELLAHCYLQCGVPQCAIDVISGLLENSRPSQTAIDTCLEACALVPHISKKASWIWDTLLSQGFVPSSYHYRLMVIISGDAGLSRVARGLVREFRDTYFEPDDKMYGALARVSSPQELMQLQEANPQALGLRESLSIDEIFNDPFVASMYRVKCSLIPLPRGTPQTGPAYASSAELYKGYERIARGRRVGESLLV